MTYFYLFHVNGALERILYKNTKYNNNNKQDTLQESVPAFVIVGELVCFGLIFCSEKHSTSLIVQDARGLGVILHFSHMALRFRFCYGCIHKSLQDIDCLMYHESSVS